MRPVKKSAGLLLYRSTGGLYEVFIVHPGGPYWQRKDAGAWSIPKGEFTENELPLHAAIREFEEEIGVRCEGDFIPLTPVKQKNRKQVFAWALQKDIDAAAIHSNSFEIEYPPRSGKYKSYPEVDKGGWFSMAEACIKLNAAQALLLQELEDLLKAGNGKLF